MERKITNELFKWKSNDDRKPMLLYGVTGSGKTYSALSFGKDNYKNVIYFDCSNNIELTYVLKKNNTMEKIVRGLSAISLETIMEEDSLIVFDNVNEQVMKAVRKYFVNTKYHIMMITNSKEFIFANKSNDYVLKIMNLVSFPEYLKYIGREQLIDFIISSFKTDSPMPFHAMAMEEFNDYVITGGYPQAIVEFKERGDMLFVNSVHGNRATSLKGMLMGMDNMIDIRRGMDVFDNVSVQLTKDNKKFQYGHLKNGARAKEYDKAIKYLINNDLLYKSYKVSSIKLSLNSIKDKDSFKLYYNDSGILFKELNTTYNRVLSDDRIMDVLYENNLACTLVNNGFMLYYYQSDGKSKLPFVVQTRSGKVIPIEMVKSNMSKSKSLSLAMSKFKLKSAIRVGVDNFKVKNGVKYVPYYAVFCIKDDLL